MGLGMENLVCVLFPLQRNSSQFIVFEISNPSLGDESLYALNIRDYTVDYMVWCTTKTAANYFTFILFIYLLPQIQAYKCIRFTY